MFFSFVGAVIYGHGEARPRVGTGCMPECLSVSRCAASRPQCAPWPRCWPTRSSWWCAPSCCWCYRATTADLNLYVCLAYYYKHVRVVRIAFALGLH